MGDGPGLAEHVARGDEELDDLGLGLLDGLALDLGVGEAGGRRIGALPAFVAEGGGTHATLAGDERPGGQGELAPPDHVGGVAEGADHGDARALLRVGQLVREHWDLHTEQRRGHGGPEQRLVALVVGMGDKCHAGGQELGSGRLDLDGPSVGTAEGQTVVGARPVAILELGLADRGAEVDVPEGRRLGLVDLAASELAEEGPLGGPLGHLADGGVLEAPVDAQAQGAPQGLEDLLILRGQAQAELDEVRPRDRNPLLARLGRWREVRVVGE